MATLERGTELDLLTGLGNGYTTQQSGESPLLIGGGVGVPPLYDLTKLLVSEGKSVTAILGF
ncbi:MAG TPA: dihydroorotate dehydrogenase electron transfer subunit, partial [Clostridiales bacterium]|nr:dihydroorotate dehydrogenase electron transfer subunit [Clostridiales bacterium]